MIKFLRKMFGVKQPTVFERINKQVNQQVWYKKDKQGFDNLKAALDLKEGDCEDIAGTKLLYLKKEGIPPHTMTPLLCRNGKEWHIVLCVLDRWQVLVLDNKTDEICTLDDIPYTPWYTTSGGTYYRAKTVQEKYEKLFLAL